MHSTVKQEVRLAEKPILNLANLKSIFIKTCQPQPYTLDLPRRLHR